MPIDVMQQQRKRNIQIRHRDKLKWRVQQELPEIGRRLTFSFFTSPSSSACLGRRCNFARFSFGLGNRSTVKCTPCTHYHLAFLAGKIHHLHIEWMQRRRIVGRNLSMWLRIFSAAKIDHNLNATAAAAVWALSSQRTPNYLFTLRWIAVVIRCVWDERSERPATE